ncbi:hypothetical protein BKA65DRAFT_557845 [Rhexocercosporidium sp. MPI-PUGE-AT-0058]|nr:hypothetical protein BKA65DRAFT_557845 [Rhexocercosporidium sp. MPI-PUGE-AT-0058]
METLPNELRRAILARLPLRDLKHIRQTSKSWGLLGQEYLIVPDFRTLPHRPDTLHLKGISSHPAYAPCIQSIHFNHGEVNEYSGRHNSYFLQYLMVPEERLTQQHVTWDAYAYFKQLTDKFLPSSCDEDTLTDIFSRLPNLTSLKISLMLCPFIKWSPHVPDLLANIWIFPSTRLLPRVATVERMTSIMNAVAANSATLSIDTLSHDRLPFEFFFQNQNKMAVISSAFKNLTSLTLFMDYSDLPNNTHSDTAFSNLVKCLRAAPLLQALSLAFQGRRKVDIAPLLSSFAADGYTFQHLSTLQFQGMTMTEDDLVDFLVRHKATLAHITIGGAGVRAVRQPPTEANGCAIFLEGDLKGLESGEVWVFERPVAAEEAVASKKFDELPDGEMADVEDAQDASWPV